MDKFYPRSFNMGVRAEVYKTLGGFLKCVLERILISVSEYSREAMSVGCFPRRGYGTNAVRT